MGGKGGEGICQRIEDNLEKKGTFKEVIFEFYKNLWCFYGAIIFQP